MSAKTNDHAFIMFLHPSTSPSFCLLPHLFLKRLAIQDVPFRTPLDDPARVRSQFGTDFSVNLLFLSQFTGEHTLNFLQDPPILAFDLDERALFYRREDDVREVTDLVFRQHPFVS